MKKTKKKKPGITFRMAPKKLSDLRAAAARASDEAATYVSKDSQESDVAPDGDEKAEPSGKPARRRESAISVVVGAAFDAAASKHVRRRLTHSQALAAIVVVPTAAWVVPMAAHVRSVFGSRWCLVTREGTDRKHNATVGSEEVARDLSRGMCVMGIAADAGLLPAALTATADVTIRIAPPDGQVLRKAITRFARRSPGELLPGLAAGLDLYEIVAAFRPGTGPRDIVRRLEAATGAGRGNAGRVPDLESAVEYGEARPWGLDLVTSVKQYNLKLISWRDIDRGICLYGPPGTGKTLFAQVLAKACGVPLVTTSVGAWFADGPGYLDSVIKAMRGAFARAAALASPVCILFLDEIDALPDRETLSERGRDWWMPVITDALVLLDSAIDGRAGIVVVGATNAIERVDKALLRPGRLEKIVEIGRPDAAGAANILRFHLDGELSGEDLADVGALLDGSTGAEIMHAVRTARRSARNAGRPFAIDDLRRAVLPIDEIAPALLLRMTVHEAAHAVAALALGAGVVRHVVLRANGASAGRTVIDFGDDPLETREGIENRVIVGLAGRAAERIFTGAISTGSGGAAHSDVGSATKMIAALHASYGMGEDLVYRGAGDDLLHELALDPGLRARVATHLRELQDRADRLVEANCDAIRAVAERLAAKRFLGGAEVEEIVRGRPGAAPEKPRSADPSPPKPTKRSAA